MSYLMTFKSLDHTFCLGNNSATLLLDIDEQYMMSDVST